ncbi:MAG: hypothetical protein AAFX53_17985 [Bacteroidota bacterium]
MRTYIFVLLALVVGTSCRSYKQQESPSPNKVDFSTKVAGKVYKIDSVDDYHLVYLSDDKTSYKIISKKSSRTGCKEVALNGEYELKVVPLLSDAPPSSGNSNIPVPINHLDIEKCVEYGDIKICTEPGISNLYSSPSLTGLCLTKKN